MQYHCFWFLTVLVIEIGQKFFGENSVQSGCGWNLMNIMTPERHLFNYFSEYTKAKTKIPSLLLLVPKLS